MKRLLSVLLAVILLFGCAPENTQTSAVNDMEEYSLFNANTDENLEATSMDALLHDNILNMSMRNPLTLNPLLNEDETVDKVLKLVFEHVAVLDQHQKPMPNLAESFEFSDDGLEVTVRLRDDIYFSDGTQMTSDDLYFSLNTIKNAAGAQSIYKNTVSIITSYTRIDRYTLSARLSRPTGAQAYMFCFPVISQSYYSNQTDPGSGNNMRPMGTGAYKYDNYTLVKELSLKANELYFKGVANIEAVNVLIIDDYETDFYAFDQSVIDVITADVLDWGKYSGSKQTIITEFNTNYYDFIGFNFRNNVLFEDIRVREAVAHCLDVDEMVESIYLGHAVRTNSVINPTSWLYEENLPLYEYDKEYAKTLLAQAGFSDNDGNGYLGREASGINIELDIRILVNEENSEKVKIAHLLRENLDDIGVKSQVIETDFDEYVRRLRAGEYDLFVGSFNFSVLPDFTFAFNSTQTTAGSNFFHYRSDALDSYLYSASTAGSEEAFVQALSEVQTHIAAELPCISLVFRKSAVLTDDKIRGEKRPVINNPYSDVYSWLIH